MSAFVEISPEHLPQPIPDSELGGMLDEFSFARTAITAATSLIAYQMYQCEYIFTVDPAVKTAAALVANGKNYIFINPTMWEDILESSKERAFVLLHEILHIFLEHQGRQTDLGYHHELWNIATDYYINLVCSGTYRDQHGQIQYATKYTKFFSRPSWVLYKERFLGMSSDEIYHTLLKEHDGDAEAAAKAHGGGKRPGQPSDGEGSEGGDGQMPIDSVSPIQPSDREASKNRRIVASAVAKASKEKTIGENEGGLVMHFHDVNAPKIHWRDQMDVEILASAKDRSTYNRLSRRTDPSSDIFMPSHYGDAVKVVWGVDTSGSMGQDDYTDAASETKGIMDQFDNWEVVLLSCDVKANVVGEFTSEQAQEFEEFDIRLIGGGGTNMQPIIDYAVDRANMGDDLNACVVLTDGHIPIPRIDPFSPIPVIIVVTRSGNQNLEVPGAKVIQMSKVGK